MWRTMFSNVDLKLSDAEKYRNLVRAKYGNCIGHAYTECAQGAAKEVLSMRTLQVVHMNVGKGYGVPQYNFASGISAS